MQRPLHCTTSILFTLRCHAISIGFFRRLRIQSRKFYTTFTFFFKRIQIIKKLVFGHFWHNLANTRERLWTFNWSEIKTWNFVYKPSIPKSQKRPLSAQACILAVYVKSGQKQVFWLHEPIFRKNVTWSKIFDFGFVIYGKNRSKWPRTVAWVKKKVECYISREYLRNFFLNILKITNFINFLVKSVVYRVIFVSFFLMR